MTIFCEKVILTDTAIILNLQHAWSQDDVPSLIESFFQHYPVLKKIDWSQGADLDAIRFKWESHDFTLHFERYGQSTWIDCSEENSEALLSKLQKMVIAV